MNELIIFTDGGARGNPGPAAAGVVISTTDGTVVEEFGHFMGHATNNQAEYTAVKLALEAVSKYMPEKVSVFMDSELVCRQLNGQYKVKNPELRIIFHEIQQLASALNVTFEHVYRANNKAADRQVNIAIDQALDLQK